MAWTFNQKEAVFIQIANRLRWEIVSGKYKPSEQIPPVRQLAMEAAVNPNTMQKALALLEEKELLFSHGTVGRFVTSDIQLIEKERETMRKEAVRGILEQAQAINISAQELINYIKEEMAL